MHSGGSEQRHHPGTPKRRSLASASPPIKHFFKRRSQLLQREATIKRDLENLSACFFVHETCTSNLDVYFDPWQKLAFAGSNRRSTALQGPWKTNGHFGGTLQIGLKGNQKEPCRFSNPPILRHPNKSYAPPRNISAVANGHRQVPPTSGPPAVAKRSPSREAPPGAKGSRL